MNKLDEKGVTARNLYNEIATGGADYNERRKEQTNTLRSALTPVWAALKAHKPVNGCTTITDWCRRANPNPKIKNPERWFQKVMGEVSSPRPKVVKLTEGMTVSIDGKKFKLESVDAVQGGNTGWYNGTLGLRLIEEPKKTVPKKTERLRHLPRPLFGGVALCADISLRHNNEAKGQAPSGELREVP